MDPVVHFEMPYDDRLRMVRFYESAFGWQTQTLGEEMGHYVLTTTTDTGESGPKKPGAINGGFYPRKPDWPDQCLSGGPRSSSGYMEEFLTPNPPALDNV